MRRRYRMIHRQRRSMWHAGRQSFFRQMLSSFSQDFKKSIIYFPLNMIVMRASFMRSLIRGNVIRITKYKIKRHENKQS